MKTLPAKYYLDHFKEFLTFVTGPSQHLLAADDLDFVERFQALSEDQQCLLVRAANRKYPVFRVSSMDYEEIREVDTNLSVLIDQGQFHHPQQQDVAVLATVMTKSELVSWLKPVAERSLSSMSKDALVSMALAFVSEQMLAAAHIRQEFLVRSFEQQLRYFLFLYFGDMHGRLNQFSMRDLGVMQTRQSGGNGVARFDNRQQAQSAFAYARCYHDLKYFNYPDVETAHANLPRLPEAVGEQALRLRDKYLFFLGSQLLPAHPQWARLVLAQSDHPEAKERFIRESYKAGMQQEAKAALLEILEQPATEGLLVFAEDFLARKFASKRTSVFTDMLRDAERVMQVDDSYRNDVEAGVVDHYQNNGATAVHVENRLWRSLFGLVFWPLMFDSDEQMLANEFDRLPRALRTNDFYPQQQQAIESCLNSFNSAAKMMQHVTAVAASEYGVWNGLFGWHSDLLQELSVLVNNSPIEAIHNQLRQMTINYRELADGYPDLMVLENGTLRFEEVKGPGDQLRKNQLVTLRSLQQSGFNVGITRVELIVDPSQPYVVVDIETTGGRANFHRITEVAMLKVVDGKVMDQWQSLINPGRPIPAAITRLTGIDDAMVADAPGFADVAEQIDEFSRGAVFVAHNVNFDYGFIRQEFARLQQPFRRPTFCTCREMRKVQPGLPSYSLANLTSHFNIDMQQHHRAMSDARAAAELLAIINSYRKPTEITES